MLLSAVPLVGTDTSPGRPDRENPCFDESKNPKNIAKNHFRKKTVFFLDEKNNANSSFPVYFSGLGVLGTLRHC